MSPGWTVRGHIPKGDHQSSIRCIYTHMPVTRKSPGRINRISPGFSIIIAEHHQAVAGMIIFTHQAAELSIVGGSENIGFTGLFTFHIGNHLRFGPGHTAI